MILNRIEEIICKLNGASGKYIVCSLVTKFEKYRNIEGISGIWWISLTWMLVAWLLEGEKRENQN